MTDPGCDIIVVGSGASAVHAAFPLVEAGRSVTMLDVGHEDTTYAPLIPDRPFPEIRRSDEVQHRYFLGDDFEGIPVGPVGAGPQVTPPRRYVFRDAETLFPTVSPGFAALESPAIGGLGGAWGAVCFPYLDREIARSAISPADLRPHYGIVARRIGISGEEEDDLSPLRGPVEPLQPPLDIDRNAERILARYRERRDEVLRDRVYLGHTLLAALSRPLGGRRAHRHHDMDFWSNAGGSVYRPDGTVREMERRGNYTYRRPFLVETFEEDGEGGVRVHARNLRTDGRETFHARRLILAAGALGTTRIVLRSLNRFGERVPLVCNSHTYVPCIHYRGLGRPPRDRCHSLAQLTMIHDPTGDREHLVQGQLYTFRSLLLFRLLQESPLPFRESLRIMRSLSPALVIWVVQHEDVPRPEDGCTLRRESDGSDRLEIRYEPSAEVEARHREHERRMMRAMRRLGCLPIRRVYPGHGSSLHYAGQFPATEQEKPLTTEPTGRLRGTRSVYLADGSVLAYLPAKGLTFTLMANANRIGSGVLRTLG